MKLAQNSLLKEKNALTVVEGELAQYNNLLASVLQEQPQRVGANQLQLSLPSAKKPKVLHAGEPRSLGLEADKESTIVEITNSSEVAANLVVPTKRTTSFPAYQEERDFNTITSTCSSDRRQVVRGTKRQPGQKITDVIQKLVQEQQLNATNADASQIDDKTKRKSLDAVVAKLHVVKNQELDKTFCVDLGSAKLVREHSKLDTVVEKLTAKQNQSQLFPTSYLVHHEVKTAGTNECNILHTEADTSVDSSNSVKVTIPNLTGEDDKMEFGSVQGVKGKVVTNSVDSDGKLKYKQKASCEEKNISEVDNEKSVNDWAMDDSSLDIQASPNKKTQIDLGGKSNVQKLASPGTSRTVTVKVIAVANQEPSPANSTVSSSSKSHNPKVIDNTSKNVLAKVTNNLTQKYQMKSVDLEILLEHDEFRDNSVHITCDGLTEYCTARAYTAHHQSAVVSDVAFMGLLQVQECYLRWLYTDKYIQYTAR